MTPTRPGVVAGRGTAHIDARAAHGCHVARQRRHVARQRRHHRGADVRSAAQREQSSQHLHHQPRYRRPHRTHVYHDHGGESHWHTDLVAAA